LIAQNGGIALIDETTVFRMDPTASTAVIHFTKDQVVGFFNQALGLTVTTVVDTTGITFDPQGAQGDLLLTNGSSSAALKGAVVSSRNGGVPFFVQGLTTRDWFSSLGTSVGLDALSLSAGPNFPSMRSTMPMGSSTAGGVGTLHISGATLGSQIRLAVSSPVLPTPSAWTSPLVTGFRMLYPNQNDPFFAASLQVNAWLLPVNSFGEAQYTFNYMGLPAGTAAIIQGVELPSGLVTNPVPVTVLP
jgi:hypothetical protein